MVKELTDGIDKVYALICYPYLFSVVGITWAVLKYILKNRKDWMELAVLVVTGIVLSLVWKLDLIEDHTTELTENLFISFIAAMVSYEWLINKLINKITEKEQVLAQEVQS